MNVRPGTANRWLLAIALLGFVLRLGYAAETGALLHPRVWESEQIAANLVERHVFLFEHRSTTYRSYMEPMYPFLAAAVYLVTGHSRTALVLVQLLIAAITVWFCGQTARLASGSDAVGVVAALLAAAHPGLIAYSTVLHPLVLDALLVVAAGLALIRYGHESTLGRGLVAGAVIGVGGLTRPTILVFILPLCWMAWRSQARAAARLRRAAVVVAVTLAMVAPWTLRNAFVHHTFMLTRSGTGFVFWLGNNPLSTGGAIDAAGRPLHLTMPAEFVERIDAADETTRDRIFSDAAWDNIRSDPAAAVRRVVQRLGHFWWFSPQWGQKYSGMAKLGYGAWWAALLLLMALGAVRSLRLPPMHRSDMLLLAALALLISLVQSLYYVEGRHRLAIEPLLLPLAALGAWSIISPRPCRSS